MGIIGEKISEKCNKLSNYFTSHSQNIELEIKESSIYSKTKTLSLTESLLEISKNANSNKVNKKNFIELKEYKSNQMIISEKKERKNSITLNNFNILRLIGAGSFGKVFLAELKNDKSKQYAMKILEKEKIIEWKQENNIFTERYILQNLKHPFISKLSYAFQDSEKLYLVTDFMPGGDLMHKLISYGKLSERTAKIYASELFLAINFLHKNDIIFRDLKPENILLDDLGHIKLTDFGLSKKLNNSNINNNINNRITYSICGTPYYIAPEVYFGNGYSKEIDWWSFGIVLYEMLTGKCPFKKDKDNQRNINREVNFDLDFPLSDNAKDLISKLLVCDVEKRLTNPLLIMNHKFFSGIDWDDIYNKKVIPDKGNSSNLSNKSVEEQLTENFDKKYIENKKEVEKVFENSKKDNNYITFENSFPNFSFCEKEQILA